MEIATEQEYNKAFIAIDQLIAENFEESEEKQEQFLEIAKAIQDYEKEHYPIVKPEIPATGQRFLVRNA